MIHSHMAVQIRSREKAEGGNMPEAIDILNRILAGS